MRDSLIGTLAIIAGTGPRMLGGQLTQVVFLTSSNVWALIHLLFHAEYFT